MSDIGAPFERTKADAETKLLNRVSAGLTHLAFAAAVTAVLLIRLRLLRDRPYPTGLDGGNWLAFGHALLGEHIRSSSLVYPPVVPLLAVTAERLLGTFSGLKALEFVAGAALPIGAYILMYAWGLRWRGVILASLVAASAGTGEAMAWGGYPQLIGLGILPVFLLAVDRFAASRGIGAGIACALLALAALATSDFVGPITIIAGVIYFFPRYALALRAGNANSARNVLFTALFAVVAALPVVPIYLGLLAGVLANEKTKAAGRVPATALIAFNSVTQDFAAFWTFAFVVAALAPFLLLTGQRRWPLATMAVLVPPSALLLFGGENRLAYILPLGIVMGLAAWLEALSRLPNWVQRTAVAALIPCVVLDLMVGTEYFATQRDYYTILNPGLVQGFQVVESDSAPGQLIAVSPTVQDWELGWWIEGVDHRTTLDAGNPIFLNFSDEKIRNAEGNQIFTVNLGMGASVQEARADGAAFLLVDKNWSGYNDWIEHTAPGDKLGIVYENSSVVVVKTGA